MRCAVAKPIPSTPPTASHRRIAREQKGHEVRHFRCASAKPSQQANFHLQIFISGICGQEEEKLFFMLDYLDDFLVHKADPKTKTIAPKTTIDE